jgi:ATP-dependent Clp endopeptidase proteolytic subunit ClpP
MQTWYAVNRKSETPSQAEVMIYDAIGAWGITAEQFIRDLKAIDAEKITIRINTPGGEVFDGFAIYNAIRNHAAEITTQVDGLAASAGSLIAIAGSEVRMAKNSYLMIHNTQGGVMGDADAMRKEAALLEKLNSTIADAYDAKAGKGRKYWLNLMSDETWMTAGEAVDAGLADEVLADEPAAAKNFHGSYPIYNQVPDEVFKRFGIGKPLTSAPEPLPSGSVTPVSQTQETLQMSTANPSTPAPIPAAPVAVVSPQVDPADEHAREMNRLRNSTAEVQYEQGRLKGVTQGLQEAVARFNAIVDCCPGNSSMAIEAFRSGQSPESVRLAFNESAKVEAAAKQRERLKDLEIARLQNLAALGGQGPIGTGRYDTSVEAPSDVDPKIVAEQEWDHNPRIRSGFSTKERYIAVRIAELSGQFRTQKASVSE